MKRNTRILTAAIIVIAARLTFAGSLIEDISWQEEFDQKSVTGVFVFCKNSSELCTTNSKARAFQSFIPASTFKIPNALIALETGVVKDAHQVFKWDGKSRPLEIWERDFNLRGAIQFSAVPVFQQFAREIGESRMQSFLTAFGYGNAQIGGGIDLFWLNGDLRISAMEQIQFLESLHHGKVPVSERSQLIVKDALTSESSTAHIVRAKTGYTGVNGKIQPGIAWWVGWVESGIDIYFFAFNMDIHDENKLSARKSIPIKLMKSEGVPIGD